MAIDRHCPAAAISALGRAVELRFSGEVISPHGRVARSDLRSQAPAFAVGSPLGRLCPCLLLRCTLGRGFLFCVWKAVRSL